VALRSEWDGTGNSSEIALLQLCAVKVAVPGTIVESLRSDLRDSIRCVYFFGLIMMCAPAVPGYISHGAFSLGLVDSPVDCGVAKGK
jgi:hypothetical protein